MKNEEFYKNEVYLKGKIINIFKADGGKKKKACVIVTIHVGNGNFPQVVCWEHNAKSILTNYKIGDTICILANMQSSRRVQNEKIKTTCSLFCTKILKSNYFTEYYHNEFTVRGKTVSSIISNDVMSLLIRTMTAHYSTVPITIYHFNSRIHSFEEGQPTKIIGHIQTGKKLNNDNKCQFFTNFVAAQISDY